MLFVRGSKDGDSGVCFTLKPLFCLRVDFLLEHVALLEGKHEFWRDEFALLGGGIDNDALELFLHLERAEPRNAERRIVVERIGDRGSHCPHKPLCFLGTDVGFGSQLCNEILVVHRL